MVLTGEAEVLGEGCVSESLCHPQSCTELSRIETGPPL